MELFKPNRATKNRQLRLSEQVQRFISSLVLKKSLPPVIINDIVIHPDPLITIARTDVSPDMKNAKIYIRHLDDTRAQDALKYLDAVKSSVRHFMAKELNLRFTPELVFKIDTQVATEERINALFQQIKEPAHD